MLYYKEYSLLLLFVLFLQKNELSYRNDQMQSRKGEATLYHVPF